MAKLLVLALAETTRDFDKGYEVIARNLDNDEWAIIPSLPKELLIINGQVAWDIFATTEADIKTLHTDTRSGIFEVSTENYQPFMMTHPIQDNAERSKLLDAISMGTVGELSSSPEWVGLLKEPIITDIYFKERFTDHHNYNPKQTFYWGSRILFTDCNGASWSYAAGPGVSCKDMRFKAYWRDLFLSRKGDFEDKKGKWLAYMRDNTTYLLIEFIPNRFHGTVSMVSGVISIKKDSERC